jgi:chromosome partitioning protein
VALQNQPLQKCALEGLKVLCIDLDPQATLTLGFGFVPDIHLEAEDTICAALAESAEKIREVTKITYFDGISLIPANLALADMELFLPNLEEQKPLIPKLGKPHERLKKALNLVKDTYDVIVLDCGPNLGILTINAVTAANGLLVPIPPMMADFGSFVTFSGTLSALFGGINKSFDFFKILLTKHSSSNEAKSIEKSMRERFGRYMLTNHIVSSVEIEKAAAQFGSVYEMPRTSNEPYKRAIKSLDSVFNEIIDAFKIIWKTQVIAKTSTSINNEGDI